VKLRCTHGDIAVITRDYPDCLDNVGRLVEVCGPMRINEAGPSWLIRPVSAEPYVLHESDHTLCRERVTWKSCVTHPDAWMTPLNPGQQDAGEDDEKGQGRLLPSLTEANAGV
jgi:hypothetical protein